MTEPQYKDADWLEQKYWREGLTQEEIGELCGVSHTTISNAMQENSVESRNNSLAAQNNYARFVTDSKGYERWWSHSRETDGQCSVAVHRLLAVAEHRFDAVRDKIIHRGGESGRLPPCEVPWANWPSNLSIMDVSSHNHHHQTKISWIDILRIREIYRNGDCTRRELGELFGLAEGTVGNIHNKRRAYTSENLKQNPRAIDDNTTGGQR